MDYENFIAYLEESCLEYDQQDLYDFAQLKIARHELSTLLAKNSFAKDSEEKLQSILNRLNYIHANQAHLEKEVEAIFQEKESSFKKE